MHEYYRNSIPKIKKENEGYLRFVKAELEQNTGKPYHEIWGGIWAFYEKNLLEHFPYIGGDKISGTKNLTGAYGFVAMGEVLKRYGVSVEDSAHLMVLAYERKFQSIPRPVRAIMGKAFSSPWLLTKMFRKKDRQNAENAAKYPGSFETKTMQPPAEGCAFTYHNLVCPLSDFAKKYGYEKYMPYLCNLDYVMFGVLGAPLYRRHTCFANGDYCDFSLKPGAPLLPYWPPVFIQRNGYQ
ncbi:L-2-amino-thiazoline-4-carboxylic acid hydrolase [Mediterraneibacter gnavus]|uniref:L-2-amino-thiazoline-4-carboxylic acid hydrolase n=1 Tax=Mediterraneibacter gnavus TaxID=33038 RepID=UPI001185C799|nr:L-2-amino-thiazoline-4-carboxylic acid hydrolase [Mediterraneibacter gnavus]